MPKASFSTIILAAGKGTRMRSRLPKVLHKMAGKPLVTHIIASAVPLAPAQIIAVIAPNMEDVQTVCYREFPPCEFAIQMSQKGTGDAVRAALPALAKCDYVLVLTGDTPLVRSETLRALLDKATMCDIAVLGMRVENPTGYGRLITDKNGNLEAIVECKDANAAEKKITLCNSGIMVIRMKYLADLLAKLSTSNASKEYYLTDIIAVANQKKLRAMVVEAADSSELMGINTRAQLAAAEAMLQQRLRAAAMEHGATLIDPHTVFFAADTQLGEDVLVHPFVVFGAGVTVGNNVEIRSYSHIEGAAIEDGAIIGPFARLRPGTTIEENAHVGNFVELKATRLGRGAKANHLSYVGDAEVGAGANIGAGTITCNYDGVNKYKTTIGSRAFIGSNSSLVAPVTIGADAMVGAGSVITEDIAAGALAIARATQIIKPGRAKVTKKK